MASDPKKLFHRGELQDELISSPAYKLVGRLRSFDLSIEIFRRNFKEIESAIVRHTPTNVMGVIRVAQNHQLRQEEQIEMTRFIHNFVAAAMSLVDHTRVFFNELYAEKNLIPDYQDQIKARFVNDQIANFVKCLRQFCQHYRLPLIATQLRIDVENQEIETGVSLRKTDLEQFSGWTKPAKGFIEKAPEEIDLLDVIRAYANQVEEFYSWFAAKQREANKTELDYYDKTVEEIRRLGE